MDALISYNIPFSGLRAGIHTFDFQADASFFAAIPDSPISDGLVNATLKFDKRNDMFIIDFDFSGNIQVTCDRCADDYAQTVKGKTQFFVKFAETPHETDEITYISYLDSHFNVAHFLYESIVLALPIRRIHPNNSCNPIALALINGSSQLAANAETDDALENPFAKALKGLDTPPDK